MQPLDLLVLCVNLAAIVAFGANLTFSSLIGVTVLARLRLLKAATWQRQALVGALATFRIGSMLGRISGHVERRTR